MDYQTVKRLEHKIENLEEMLYDSMKLIDFLVDSFRKHLDEKSSKEFYDEYQRRTYYSLYSDEEYEKIINENENKNEI